MLAMQKLASRSQLGDDPTILDETASLTNILRFDRVKTLLNM